MKNINRCIEEDTTMKRKKLMSKKKFRFSKNKKHCIEKIIYPFKKFKCILPNEQYLFSCNDLKNKKYFIKYDPLQCIPSHYFKNINTNNILNVHDFKMIDEKNGCYCSCNNNIPVFILIPRKQSLNCGPLDIKHQEKSLLKLVHGIAPTSRGKSKDAVYSCYATLGAHANRGAHGISYKFIKKNLLRDFNVVVKMVQKAEHCAQNILPSAVINALKRTKEKFEWSCIITTKTNDIKKDENILWSSVATSYDYASATHTDNDFFLSMLTVTTSEHTISNQYAYDQPIALYFNFPELGLSVGLRPGDQLIFNPLYYHCVSTKNFAVYKNHVHVTSFYLKTAIVGGNNNKRELESKLFI
jgi:hypothetical protein